MKVCTTCWDSNCNRKDHNKIEIDDNIVDVICLLNKKGYMTLFCCGGHINRTYIKNGMIPNIYISFNKYCDKVQSLDVNLPPHWKWFPSIATLRFYLEESKTYKNTDISKSDFDFLESELEKHINELREFVNQLP